MRVEAGDGEARPGDAEIALQAGGGDLGDGDDVLGAQAKRSPGAAPCGSSPARRAAPARPASSPASRRRRARRGYSVWPGCAEAGGVERLFLDRVGDDRSGAALLHEAHGAGDGVDHRLARCRHRACRARPDAAARSAAPAARSGRPRRLPRARRWRAPGHRGRASPASCASRSGTSRMKKGGRFSALRARHAFSVISPPTPAGSPMVRTSGARVAALTRGYPHRRCGADRAGSGARSGRGAHASARHRPGLASAAPRRDRRACRP